MRKKYGGRITAIYDIPPAELTVDVPEETGHLARYCVNITDRQDRMIEYARHAVYAGAGALLVNFVATGLGALQALAEDPVITFLP